MFPFHLRSSTENGPEKHVSIAEMSVRPTSMGCEKSGTSSGAERKEASVYTVEQMVWRTSSHTAIHNAEVIVQYNPNAA